MMKLFFTLALSSVLLAVSCSDNAKPASDSAKKYSVAAAPKMDTGFDAALAQKLGADEYGMHAYVMAFLKTGPKQEKDTVKAKALLRAHLDNIHRLADEGKLALAGPFTDGGELEGIFIFNVATVEEARKLTETDPLIQSGGLVMDLHPWYGTAALQQVVGLHDRVAKTKF